MNRLLGVGVRVTWDICQELRRGGYGHRERANLSHSAEVLKEEPAEESLCLKPWKVALLLNVIGKVVGDAERVGARMGRSAPGPENQCRCPADTRSMSLDLRLGICCNEHSCQK